MIEVFKTNIENGAIANVLAAEIGMLFPGSSVDFDLDDCDRILRIKGHSINAQSIIDILGQRGYFCELLQ